METFRGIVPRYQYIISYPCCENGVRQDVRKKPAGIRRGNLPSQIP